MRKALKITIIIIMMLALLIIVCYKIQNSKKQEAYKKYVRYATEEIGENVEIEVYYSFKMEMFQGECKDLESGITYIMWFDKDGNVCATEHRK